MCILDDLYYGRIRPAERTLGQNSRYKMVLGQYIAEESALRDTLSKKQKELFSAMEKSLSDLSAISEYDTFICGFRIGARMILDVFVCGDLP